MNIPYFLKTAKERLKNAACSPRVRRIGDKCRQIGATRPGRIGILLLFGFFLYGSKISIEKFQNGREMRRFLVRHPDRVMFWDLPKEKFLDALPSRLRARDLRLYVHTVQKGDNYWKIAKTNRTDIDTVLGSNPFIKNLFADIGDRIVAVSRKGVLHFVMGNERPALLSGIYGVPEKRIRSENGLGPFSRLRQGDILFIPDAKPRVFTRKLYEAVRARQKFINPVHGWLGVPFGTRIHPVLKVRKFHKGVDLGAPKHSAIFASAGGVVTAAGMAGDYGNVVIINHGDGYETVYAHCARVYVRIGQKVKQRQIIASVGATGMATIHHLHFEVRYKGKCMDPLKVLW